MTATSATGALRRHQEEGPATGLGVDVNRPNNVSIRPISPDVLKRRKRMTLGPRLLLLGSLATAAILKLHSGAMDLLAHQITESNHP